MNVGLINFNRRGVRERDVPPVPPLGLEYLAEDLETAHEVSLLDLCFVDAADVTDAVAGFVSNKDAIGITFRNIGVDCHWLPDQQTFVPALCRIVSIVKSVTRVPVVLGGQGFSIYPQQRIGILAGLVGPSVSRGMGVLLTERPAPSSFRSIRARWRGVAAEAYLAVGSRNVA